MPHRRARLGALAIVVATLIGVGGLVAAPGALAAPAAAPAAPAIIRGVESGRCLDVYRADQRNGAGVVVSSCRSAPQQLWQPTAAGELRVFGGTKCLDVRGASTSAGTPVQSYACNGGAWQRWILAADGTIRGVGSGQCLDVSGRATADGSPVIIWPCNGQTNQRWRTTLTATTRDTSAPSAPGTPSISAVTCTRATLSWTAATDDVAVVGYDVYHDGQFMVSVAGSARSVVLTVTPGAQWGVYVNARDGAGNVSQASRTVPLSVPQCQADTRAPTTPDGLTATASGTAVTLTWTASTDDVGVRSYDVLRDGVKVGSVTGAPPSPRFLDSGLAPSRTYRYNVVARDAQDNASPASTTATVSTGAACAGAVCGVTQVATDTDLPWGLTTLPDGSVLYSRRDAHELVRLNPATGATTTLGTVPGVTSTDGEGGLLGVAVSPTFSTDRWVYAMHTSATDNRVVRLRLNGDQLDTASVQVLVSGMGRNKYHNGGRLRFGPDGKLYVSTGDAQVASNAQNLSSLDGKILRVDPDGSIPADNPFGTAVWSYGHRNPQGLAFDSQGRLWEQEFGNSVMDETNLITRGGNYGWPMCEGTTGACGTAGLTAPKATYPTADGSCSGIAVVDDVLYIACLRGARLYRAPISGTSLGTPTSYFSGTYGRLRTVEPDGRGGLWLTTTNTGDKDSIANNSREQILRVTLGG